MNRTPSADYLAQVTKFERFLILNKRWLMWASFLAAFLITAFRPPHIEPYRAARQNGEMQEAHAIDVCLFSYAIDHNGKYPLGTSSTDVVQQLIDQKYVADPSVFYFAMPGKTTPATNKLKPENVCFDVTNAVQPDDPDTLPLVFSTGYKIDYVKGGKAHFVSNGDPAGIAVAFKDNRAAFLKAQPEGIPLRYPTFDSNYSADFDSKGRTYQQLTPDGKLP